MKYVIQVKTLLILILEVNRLSQYIDEIFSFFEVSSQYYVLIEPETSLMGNCRELRT